MGRFGGAASGKSKTARASAASGLVPKVRRTMSRRSVVMAAALTTLSVVLLCSNALAAVSLEALPPAPIEGSLASQSRSISRQIFNAQGLRASIP